MNNIYKYKKFMSYIGPFKIKRFFITTISLISLVVNMFIPFLLGNLINKVQNRESLKNIFAFSMIVLLLGFLSIFLNSLQNYTWHVYKIKFMNYFRTLMLDSFFKKKSEYLKNNFENISSKILQDTENISKDISIGVPILILNISHLLIVLFFMLKISFKLTIIVIILVPAVMVFLGFFQSSIGKNSLKEREAFSTLTDNIKEYTEGIFQIKVFKKEKFFLNKFKENIKTYELFLKKLRLFTSLNYAISNLSIIMLPIIILIFGSIEVNYGRLTLGYLFSFYFYLGFIYSPIENLTNAITNLQISLGMSDRIINFLEDDMEDITKGREISKIDKIEIKNLSFSYDGKNDIFKNLNFNLKKGDIVAIVGDSGTGKTTFTDILLKFWQNYKGNIFINDVELNTISKKSYYNRVSYLEQSTFLFKASLFENISFKKYEDEKLIKSVKISKVDKIIENKNEKNFFIQSDSKNLSVGERQRIALARSLYKDFDMLILDEFTSSLDNDTEEEIVKNIKEISKDKIILIITHRNYPLSICNKIINLNNYKKIV